MRFAHSVYRGSLMTTYIYIYIYILYIYIYTYIYIIYIERERGEVDGCITASHINSLLELSIDDILSKVFF